MDPLSNSMINLKWPEIEKAAREGAILLWPLGVIEEHGPHLCLGTDMHTAQAVCCQVQEKLLKEGIGSMIAPPFHWGICQSTRGFIGSFTIRMETAKNLVFDILHSLHSFGFQEIYGINAHGDIEQNVLFMDSFRSAYAQIGIRARYCFRKEVMHLYGLDGHEDFICPVEPAGISVSAASESDVHAGDIETAVMVRYFGRCADTAVAETMPPVTLEPGKEMEWLLGGKTKELSANGYVGNPARYAEVRIDAYMDDISQRYATAIIDKRRA